jgi:hypothetical protein
MDGLQRLPRQPFVHHEKVGVEFVSYPWLVDKQGSIQVKGCPHMIHRVCDDSG